MKTMTDTIIFDLDGTLIDSVPDVRHALNDALVRHGHSSLTLTQVRSLVGEGAAVMIGRALGTAADAPEVPGVLTDYLAAYRAQPVLDTTLYPGAVPALERLAAKGARLGVCTNKPAAMARLVLERLELTRCFAAILGPEDVARRKPHGDHILDTVRAIGGDPARTVMVGDSETDAAAARAAGVPFVAVSFGYCGEAGAAALGADRVIDHFDQLDAAIAELLAG